jgi:XTP/dITP diphosphohydrolase
MNWAYLIAVLNGFPGPYAAYVLNTIGISGILKLMEGRNDTRAQFVTALAYAEGMDIHIFTGSIDGHIVPPRGTGGFGYDPIFEYGSRTLAELSLKEKNMLSHRGRALTAFAQWLAKKKE